MSEPLLSIRNLSVDYITDAGPVRAIDDVSLDLQPGEILGVAGESGSGKSTLAKALMRILPAPGVISRGQVLFEGRDLLQADENALREMRWKRISMVFQSAMDALNPVVKVGEQIVDTLMHRGGMDRGAARARSGELLELVGIPVDRLDNYTHQLSGGMRQRVGISLALALQPSLVILDEPTTALDVIVEREILEQILKLRAELGFAVIFITHDLARMLQFSDRIAVFYAARLAEVAAARTLGDKALHPYTHGLIKAFPSLSPDSPVPESIGGTPPSLKNPPSGCRFHPRCPRADVVCREYQPPLESKGPGHAVACHFADDIARDIAKG